VCNSQNELQTAAIIPLGHASRRDSSSLPEGFQSTMTCVIVNGARSLAETLTHRAGPALPSYLALHHAGFSVPPMLPPGRWALTPPFHPCQTTRAFRRRLAGFPARCHRAALRRRYILCGTFRSAPSGTGFSLCSPSRPLALPGALPCQEFRSSQNEERASGRCPDFPPAQPSCDDQASDHPARPPTIIISRYGSQIPPA
jgi:hypothetical protein